VVGQRRRIAVPAPLDAYLAARDIVEKILAASLGCDGYIEPRGTSYADGFRMVLNESAPATRRRFTEAHELCHTFFYELVPEIKFRPHATDAMEERLCNFGAAALLIPEADLRERAESCSVYLGTLEELAERYGVSLETTFLRIRGLRLWNCEISVWHRMMSGEFVLDRMHGWAKADWRWAEVSIPARAWERGGITPLTGQTFVYFDHANGYSAAKRVYYQIKRRGNSLIALWSHRPFRSRDKAPPLFQSLKLHRKESELTQ
jgi:IrrE N-terminal-like domain